MLRDFSEENKQRLTGLMNEVGNVNQPAVFDWSNILWGGFDPWIGQLGIRQNLNNVSAYNNNVNEKNSASVSKLSSVFNDINIVDNQYKIKYQGLNKLLLEYIKYIAEMENLISQKGNFTVANIKKNMKTAELSVTTSEIGLIISNVKPKPSWFEKFFKSNVETIKKGRKIASQTLIYLSKFLKIPTFKIDGKYFKVLNNINFKGGNGYARWYTIDNILNNKYPNATKAYKWGVGLKTTGKILGVIGSGVTFFQEYFKDDTLSQERRISNGLVEVATALGAAKVGAVIGGAVGSIVPGAGTAVGAVVGGAVGFLATVGINAATEIKIWDGGTKTTKDVIKDVVGAGVDVAKDMAVSGFNAAKDIAVSSVNAASDFVGDCAVGAGKFIDGMFSLKFITGA